MNNGITRILLMFLLLLVVTAPFAGLAPLMLVLLVTGVFWLLGSLVQTLFFGNAERQTASDSRQTKANG